FVPGILLYLTWMFSTQVATLEQTGITDSFRRSSKLTSGRWGELFAIIILASIINAAPLLGMNVLIPQSAMQIPVVGALVQQIPAILLGPFLPIVVALAYFDTRVRKEALDLTLLIPKVGIDLPSGAPLAAP